MSVLIVIPARYASTRYPGKPLVGLTGATGETRSLIERSWRAAQQVQGADRVVVATDDTRIRDAAHAFGAEVVMTSESCQNGTERCAEAHQALGGYPNSVFIINKKGCVLWFTDWNNPKAVERALAQISIGQPAVAKALFKPVPPWVALRTLFRGGKGATSDFFRGLPMLIWKNLIKRNWRIVRGQDVGIAPDHSC